MKYLSPPGKTGLYASATIITEKELMYSMKCRAPQASSPKFAMCGCWKSPDNRLDPSHLDSLTIHPPVDPEEVSLMMKSSKMFILFARFDPSPHVTVEAMAHGLPVICSNVCGMGADN